MAPIHCKGSTGDQNIIYLFFKYAFVHTLQVNDVQNNISPNWLSLYGQKYIDIFFKVIRVNDDKEQ